jgi:hypothetical protein
MPAINAKYFNTLNTLKNTLKNGNRNKNNNKARNTARKRGQTTGNYNYKKIRHGIVRNMAEKLYPTPPSTPMPSRSSSPGPYEGGKRRTRRKRV